MPGALVEEYLRGPEISVETVVLGPGQVRIVAVTHKSVGCEPQFQEIGLSIDAADPLLTDPVLAAVVAAAVHALGLSPLTRPIPGPGHVVHLVSEIAPPRHGFTR